MISLDEINKLNNALIIDDNKEIIDFLNNKFAEPGFEEDSLFLNSIINASNLFGYGEYLKKDKFTPNLLSSSNESSFGGYYNYGQLKVLDAFAKNEKVFLSAPTSFGKTYLVLQYIFAQDFKNILLIVPTNSLLEELYIKVLNEYKAKEKGFHVSTQPFVNTNLKNFLILTPERFLCLCETKDVSFFDICIMDESYQIQEKGRKLNCIISRAPKFRKVMEIIGRDSQKCIFMSPYTYSKTESMNRFFSKNKIVPIDSKIEYVSRQILNFDDEDFSDRESVQLIALRKDKINKKSKAAKLLIYKKNQKNIIYVSCYSDAYELLSYLPQTFTTIGNNIKQYLDRFNNFIAHLKESYKIDEKKEWAIITALEHGIGIYVSALPRYIKKEIIKLYELNIIKTLVVTTAFTEGVNTNAENLIVTSDCTAKSQRLDEIDLLNMAGRAGRFLKCPVGKIICVDSGVYHSINNAIENNNHELNFELYTDPGTEKRDNFDLDLIEDKLLSQNEKDEKEETKRLQESLDLSNNELKSALFMPKKWKLKLYESLKKADEEDINNLLTASINIMNHVDNTIVDSIELIFIFLKKTFKQEPNFFRTKQGEIKPFDNSGNFIWGRLYKNYSSKNAGVNIANNRRYIKKRLDELLGTYKYDIKDGKAGLMEKVDDSEKWILGYFDSALNEEFEKFFSESFKFQSNIMQYKIPLYITFFVSILKIFLKKNNMHANEADSLNALSIALYFEDGNYSKQYADLFDFGLPKELIDKIIENNISVSDIKNGLFNKDLFDMYENALLNDFAVIFR